MITAILDTNVFIQALISTPRSASVRTLKALDEGRFRLVLSAAALDELLEALLIPRMRNRHGLSDDEILRYVLSFVPDALILPDSPPIPASVPRDITDTKLLALAAASRADYLVTNDRRHLGRLKQFEGTRIVTPFRFVRDVI